MRFNNVNSVALEQRKLELEKDKIYLSSNEKKYGRLLSEMGRYAYFMKYFHNIEPINQDYTFLEGYNSALQVFTKEEMLDTHTFKKGYNYAEAMLKLGNIPEIYKEEPAKKHR